MPEIVDDLFQFLLVDFHLLLPPHRGADGVFVIVYRRRPHAAPAASPSHSTLLEIVWTGIPVAIVVVLFYRGFTGYMELRNAPEGAREIRVTGEQWKWQFEYPNGYVDGELHVPVDEPVLLIMTSRGRDPQPVHSGVAGEDGRGAGALFADLVSRQRGGHVRAALLRVLRQPAFRHADPAGRASARRVREVAQRRRRAAPST